MSTTDAVNIGISIGLGILSIGVSGFAVWLSFQFNDRSKEALDTVQELTREIKTSVEVGLSQQQDMSDKMLDSILQHDRYTSGDEDINIEKREKLERIIKGRMDKAESRIIRQVEDVFDRFNSEDSESSDELDRAISSIKNEITELRETATDASDGFVTPEELRSILTKYKSTPAHYSLISAILKTGAGSVSEAERARHEVFFPPDAYSGVKNLIEDGLLVGNSEDFSIRNEFREPLKNWIDANWDAITRLAEYYESETSWLMLAQG